MLELTGQTIDRFQIAARLSDEPWGAAWKARDQKFDRTVTLCTLDPVWASQGHQGEYVRNTARVVVRFRHPGVARLVDVGQGDGVDYLAQEFIPGYTLAIILQRLRERGVCLPIPEAVQIAIEVCRAVDYVHQRNLVFGNISPKHIYFKDEASDELSYQPVLTGLGLVVPDDPGPGPTHPYRAPEFDRSGVITPAMDIFALGVLLYELLTGVTPSSYPFTRPSSLRPEIPDSLGKLLQKALTPNPDHRYPDAGRMGAAFEGILPVLSAAVADPAVLRNLNANPVENLASILQAGWQDPQFGPLPPLQTPTLGDTAPAVSATAPMTAPPTTIPTPTIADTMPATAPLDLSRDRIHILEPGKAPRTFKLRLGQIYIGRSKNNGIILNQTAVSRKHARLEFDGQEYRLTDLNSTNGTFLDEKPLIPNEPVDWPAGGTVRIGETRLRLERAGQDQATRAHVAAATRPVSPQTQTTQVITSSGGRTFDPSQVAQSPDGLIGAFVENPNLVVKPGSSITLTVTLFNRRAAPDTFNITHEGLPPGWITNPTFTVQLPANNDRELNITIRPPRSSAGRAGRHPLILHIASLRAPNQAVEVRLSVTVTAFSEFFSELHVKPGPGRQVGQVVIENRGNLPETFMVLWEDRLQELYFDPPQVRMTIPPGKPYAVEYRPQLIQPRWFGSDTAHRYKVHVSAQTGEMQTHNGEYIAKALIPPWAPIGLLIIFVGLVCLVLMLTYQGIDDEIAARRTHDAMTAVAVQATGTSSAATQTVEALNTALTATALAVNARSTEEQADTDGDRLSLLQENLLGTDPNNPDTDKDNLRDGEERLDFNTNPLNPDSDGDRLMDGEEIRRSSNPLNSDTDGDGLMDGVDPDPIHIPTATFPIITPATVAPSITSTAQPLFTDLAITITNDREISTPGENVSYRIVATNLGQSELRDIAVTAALPPGLLNASWTCVSSVYSRCTTENGTGNINARVALVAGGTATITLIGTISADAANQLAITANITPPPGPVDSNQVNNQATDRDTLNARVNLTLSNTDNRETIRSGEATTYLITVRNSGPSSVNNVALRNDFPSELTNVSWTCAPSQGSSCSTLGPVTGNVNITLNLAPGGAATVTVNATVRPGVTGTVANTAAMTSPIDPLVNNKTSTDTTAIIAQANLGISVTAPISTTVNSMLTYQISITNDGPAAASAMEMATQLPADTAFISVTLSSPVTAPVCNPSGGRVHCNLGALPAGGVLQMQIVLIAPPTPGRLETFWDILAPELDPDEVNNRATNTVVVY